MYTISTGATTAEAIESKGDLQTIPRRKDGQHFKYIDGLRGLAALWVVFYHLWNRFNPGLSTQSQPVSTTYPHTLAYYFSFWIFQYGYVGVDLFFVLSGFCIHLSQARGNKEFSGREFAKRRFFRLYPVYLASLFYTSLIVGLFPLLNNLLLHKQLHVLQDFQIGNLLINATFLQLIWPSSLGFNGVYWTLVFEVQFYVFYPFLLLISKRYSYKVILIILLAIEIVFIYHPLPIGNLFFYRYYEWCLGMVAADLVFARNNSIRNSVVAGLTLVTLVLGLLSVFFTHLFPLRDVLFSTGFFLLLVMLPRINQVPRTRAGSILTALPRALEHRWVVWLGMISYSLYLIHVPMIDLCWNCLEIASRLAHLDFSIIRWLSLLSIPAALALGFTFYLKFEKPFLRRK